MKKLKSNRSLRVFLVIVLLASFAVYNLPAVQERVGWRVAELAGV